MKLVLATLALSACMSSAQPVQIVQLGASPAPPWAAVRDALADCTQLHGIIGQVDVRIEIDDDGGAGEVSATRGGGDLAHCIGKELSSVRFPRGHRGRAIEVPFTASAQASAP
jgi:hypothetical protein